ncbi:MAG: hypothetical protein ACD_58C00131G0003 [uncultured bacterium]|nr:MAG: hypothetical protein ACD_58C00131G0003 [uncultured bacterium]
MIILKQTWKKIFIISLICTIFNSLAHALWAPIFKYSPPSYFVNNGIFEISAVIALIITYILLGIVFVYIQNNLSGTKIEKGLRFGISFAGLWFFGILGMSLILNSPIKTELAVGGLDFVTLIILGLLFGQFLAIDNKQTTKNKFVETILSILIISLIYVIGRYLFYLIFDIELAYPLKLIYTLLWTFGIGFWMGLSYILLKQSLDKFSPLKKALIFGGIIIGVNWILFNLFALLLVKVSVLELLKLALSDILLVIIGVWLTDKIINEINEKDI